MRSACLARLCDLLRYRCVADKAGRLKQWTHGARAWSWVLTHPGEKERVRRPQAARFVTGERPRVDEASGRAREAALFGAAPSGRLRPRLRLRLRDGNAAGSLTTLVDVSTQSLRGRALCRDEAARLASSMAPATISRQAGGGSAQRSVGWQDGLGYPGSGQRLFSTKGRGTNTQSNGINSRGSIRG
jgi:hypothetical protein